MTANNAEDSPRTDATQEWLVEFLDNVPPPPDYRVRDFRRGAVLIALAVSMVIVGLSGLWGEMDLFYVLEIAPDEFALAAIIPAAAGVGFLIASRIVRYTKNT